MYLNVVSDSADIYTQELTAGFSYNAFWYLILYYWDGCNCHEQSCYPKGINESCWHRGEDYLRDKIRFQADEIPKKFLSL